MKTLQLQFQGASPEAPSASAQVANSNRSSHVLLSSAPRERDAAHDASDDDSDETRDVDWELERSDAPEAALSASREEWNGWHERPAAAAGRHREASALHPVAMRAHAIAFSHYATDFQTTAQLTPIGSAADEPSTCTFECTWIVPLNASRLRNVS